MKMYTGYRDESGCDVFVDGEILDPKFDLINHSPDGFEWGYCGSGPSQLAFAILWDFLEDKTLTPYLYQKFKFDVISHLAEDEFTLTGDQIQAWIDSTMGDND